MTPKVKHTAPHTSARARSALRQLLGTAIAPPPREARPGDEATEATPRHLPLLREPGGPTGRPSRRGAASTESTQSPSLAAAAEVNSGRVPRTREAVGAQQKGLLLPPLRPGLLSFWCKYGLQTSICSCCGLALSIQRPFSHQPVYSLWHKASHSARQTQLELKHT